MTRQILIDYNEFLALQEADMVLKGERKTVDQRVAKELRGVVDSLQKALDKGVGGAEFAIKLLNALISVYGAGK